MSWLAPALVMSRISLHSVREGTNGIRAGHADIRARIAAVVRLTSRPSTIDVQGELVAVVAGCGHVRLVVALRGVELGAELLALSTGRLVRDLPYPLR
jgi:hypothetical protein